MQVDIDVQDTEVNRLDPENPPLAFAFAGMVNVQVVTRPVTTSTTARVRRARARAPRRWRLSDLPLFRISDSNWHPRDRSRLGPEILPLLILQDLRPVSSGITQGPVITSLSAQT